MLNQLFRVSHGMAEFCTVSETSADTRIDDGEIEAIDADVELQFEVKDLKALFHARETGLRQTFLNVIETANTQSS